MGRGHQVQRTGNGKGSPGVTQDREGVTRCNTGQGMGRGHQV